MSTPSSPAPDAAKAFKKLTRESAPVKVLRAPFQLAQCIAELDRFEKAKGVKTENFVKRFLSRRSTADLPIDVQIQALKIRKQALENDYVEGVVTPLTEAETWEVKCEWGAIRATLLERELELTGPAKDAYHKEVEKASTGIWVQKWVGIALKKKDKEKDRWVRWAKPGDFENVEPVALDLIFNIYHENFSLTDDELGKLQAPTAAAN